LVATTVLTLVVLRVDSTAVLMVAMMDEMRVEPRVDKKASK